jgi:hypothetical protein
MQFMAFALCSSQLTIPSIAALFIIKEGQPAMD